MKRRVLAILLACSMVLTQAAPAFAADDIGISYDEEVLAGALDVGFDEDDFSQDLEVSDDLEISDAIDQPDDTFALDAYEDTADDLDADIISSEGSDDTESVIDALGDDFVPDSGDQQIEAGETAFPEDYVETDEVEEAEEELEIAGEEEEDVETEFLDEVIEEDEAEEILAGGGDNEDGSDGDNSEADLIFRGYGDGFWYFLIDTGFIGVPFEVSGIENTEGYTFDALFGTFNEDSGEVESNEVPLDEGAWGLDAENQVIWFDGAEIVSAYKAAGLNDAAAMVYVYDPDGNLVTNNWIALYLLKAEECQYDREGDCTRLPGSDGSVGGCYGAAFLDFRTNEYTNVPYYTTDVEVIDGGDLLRVFPRREGGDDDYWWDYRIKDDVSGQVTFRVYYKDLAGNEDSYEFCLTVSPDTYNVNMESEGGMWRTLPGGEINLYASASHEYYDEEGEYQCDAEGLGYHWFFDNGEGEAIDESELAELIIDEAEPSSAVLRFKPLPEGVNEINESVRVGVRVLDANGEDTEGYYWKEFFVQSGYDELWPTELNHYLDVGSNMEETFEVRRFDVNNESYEVIDASHDMKYQWLYDEEVMSVTELVDGTAVKVGSGQTAEGNTFTITRLKNQYTEFKVRAFWNENGEDRELESQYEFWNRYIEFWFDESEVDVYADSSVPPALALYLGGLGENWQDRLDLTITAGHWDDEEDEWAEDGFLTSEEYSWNIDVDSGYASIALSQDYLASLENDENVRIYAEVFVKGADPGDDACVRDADAWFHIHMPRAEYDFKRDCIMLPGWNDSVNEWYGAYVENSEYPDGEDFDYHVIDVDVEQHPEQEGRQVIAWHKDEDDKGGYWWYYEAKNYGYAIVTVTYEDLDQKVCTYSFRVDVASDTYDLDLWNEGSSISLPGGTIDLCARVNHETDHGDENTEDHFKFDWQVVDGEDYVESLDADEECDEEGICHAAITFRELDEEERGEWHEIKVEVTAYETDEETGERIELDTDWINLELTSDYTELWPLSIDSNLEVGSEYEIIPEVRRYGISEEEEYVLADGDENQVHYRWYYDSEDVEIRDSDGVLVGNEDDEGEYNDSEASYGTSPTFTITRLADGDIDISLDADWIDESGEDRHEHAEYHLNSKDYDIEIDDYGNNTVYSDGSRRFPVNVDGVEKGNYQLYAELGIWDDEERTSGHVAPEDCFEIQISDDEETPDYLILDGSKLYEEFGDDGYVHAFIHILVNDVDVYEQFFHFNLEEAWSEYDFEWGDLNMLPGWDHDVYRWQGSHIRSSLLEEGESDEDIEITDVVTQDDTVVSVRYNEWTNDQGEEDHNWTLFAENLGETNVTLYYKDWNWEEGDDFCTYTFTVRVEADVYDIDVWTSDETNIAMPGNTIELKANIRHSAMDPNTGERWDESPEEIAERLQYRWSINNDGMSNEWIDYLEYPDDNESGDTVIVHLKELPDDWEDGIWQDLWINVEAVSIENPEEVFASNSQQIVISDNYYEIWMPGFDDQLWPGASVEVIPELRRYPSRTGDEKGYDVIDEDVFFRWEYNDTAIAVVDENGIPVGNYDENDDYVGSELSAVAGTAYTVTKLENWDEDIRLKVDFLNDNDDGDEREWSRRLNSRNTDLWFENDNTLYVDGDNTLFLNMDNYEDVPGGLYTLNYEIYLLDEDTDEWADEPLTEGFHVDENNQLVIEQELLSGLMDAAGGEDVNINVRAAFLLEKGDGEEPVLIGEEWRDFWVRNPGFEGANFGDENLFIGEDRTLNGFYDGSWIKLRNSQFHNDDWYPYSITNVTVDSEQDEEDPRDAVSKTVAADDEGNQIWILTAVRRGGAEITLDLDIYDPEEMEQDNLVKIGSTQVSFWYWVGDFNAWFDFRTESGSDKMRPGESLGLIANFFADTQDEYGNRTPLDTSSFTFTYDAWVDEIYDEAWLDEHPDWETSGWKLTGESGAWRIETEPDAPEQRIRVKVEAWDHDVNHPEDTWPCCSEELTIEIQNSIYAIDLDGVWNENMLPGQETVISPVLKLYDGSSDDGEEIAENVFFRFEWREGSDGDENDRSHFVITDQDGRILTHASDDGEDHRTGTAPFKIKRLVDWESSLSISAMGIDRRGNEFEYAWRNLNVNRIYCTAPYRTNLSGTEEERGGDNYTWFYVDEDTIKIWPDLTEVEAIRGQLSAEEAEALEVRFEAGEFDYENRTMNPDISEMELNGDGEWQPTGNVFQLAVDENGVLDLSDTELYYRQQILEGLRYDVDDDVFQLRTQVLFNGYELSDQVMNVSMRNSFSEMAYDNWTILPEQVLKYTDEASWVYLENADNSTGNDRDDRPGSYYPITILGIEVLGDQNQDVVQINNEDGFWQLRAMNPGEVDLEYTYQIEGEEETRQHWTHFRVSTTTFDLSLQNEDEEEASRFDLFPGQTTSLQPAVVQVEYHEEDIEDPWKPVELDTDKYEVNYDARIDSDWIAELDTSEEPWQLTGKHEGETNVYVHGWIVDKGTDETIWGFGREVHVNVRTAFTSLDLSEEQLCVEPGQSVSAEELMDLISGHFSLRTMNKPEGETIEADRVWFDGADRNVFGLFGDDGDGFNTLTTKSAEDLAERLGEDGWFESDLAIEAGDENGYRGWGSLKTVVHVHQASTLEEAEINGVTCSQCIFCGKCFDEEGNLITDDGIAKAAAETAAAAAVTAANTAEANPTEANISAANTAIAEANTKIAAAEALGADMTAAKNTVAAATATVQKTVAKVDAEAAAAAAVTAANAAEANPIEANISAANAALTEANTKIADAEALGADMTAAKNTVATASATVQKTVAKVDAEAAAAAAVTAANAAEANPTEANISAANAAITEANAKIADAEALGADMTAAKNTAATASATVQKTVAKADAEAAAAAAENAANAAKASPTEANIAAAESAIAAAKQKIQAAKNLGADVSSSESKVGAASSTVTQTKQQANAKTESEKAVADAKKAAETAAAAAVTAANTAKSNPTAANISAANAAITAANNKINAAKALGADTTAASNNVKAASTSVKQTQAKVDAETAATAAVTAANKAKANPTAENIKAAEEAITKANEAINTAKSLGADTSTASKSVSSASSTAAAARTAAQKAADEAKAAAAKAAAIAAFSLNVKKNATVPVQKGKKVTKIIATLGEGDSLATVVSSAPKNVKAGISGNKIWLKGVKVNKKATITVTTKYGATWTFKVKVQKKAVKTTKLTVAKTKVTLKVGETFDLDPVITPVTTKDTLKITNKSKKIVSVTKAGVITAKKAGKATLIVKCGTKKKTVKITVTA